MNRTIQLIGLITLLLSLTAGWFGHELSPGYWQDILVGLATTFLGLGLAVIVINHFLSSEEKRHAAAPLLKIISSNVQELHNELFVGHLRHCFGNEEFESLMNIYRKHKGNPDAFSPKQRDEIYQAIELKKTEILAVYEALQEQLKELNLLLGWSFDSKITGAALTARFHYATFKAVRWDGSEQTKKITIEAYIDAEAATSTVFSLLTKHLGLKESDWQSNN